MKTRLALIIISLLILAAALAGGFGLLWRFFIFFVVVLLLNYLWTRFSVRGVDGRAKKVPESCYVGDVIKQEFTVSNRSRIPTPVIEAHEETDLPGYGNVTAFNLPSRGSHTWYASAPCRKRGQYHVGAFTASVTDPLGFFPVNRKLGEPQDVVVYPATVDLPFFQALPRQEPGSSPRRWMASEAGPSVSRVREYTSGDSLRHIHWQSTAHSGKLMVKEFDPDRSNYAFKYIWIVLDMQQEPHAGEGEESTEEYGITIAASLTKKYLEGGKRVGMIASSDRPHLYLPETGEAQMQHLMHALALMKAVGHVRIETLLNLEAENLEPGSAVIIIMPSRDQEIAAPLRRYISRGVIVTAILLDALSFGGGTPATDMARILAANGLHVYTIERGMRISRALDSRLFAAQTQYTGIGG
ncbi:MAG: hypothetical protein A2Z29_01790 [Chloroflexi bacterium RBG_16_56_11]|nr:MAG: hypothetical protein A2Z29_01790 [Chloroflexi bacterium RBG_16_56_11]